MARCLLSLAIKTPCQGVTIERMRQYELAISITDDRRGWKVEPDRWLPRAYTITVQKYWWASTVDGAYLGDLTPEEIGALRREEISSRDTDASRMVSVYDWLRLDIKTTDKQRPLCVALHAPRGIGTPEQRAPLAGIVTEASAAIASTSSGYADLPGPIEYQDVVWELGQARWRKRARRRITPERLEEVARIAREHPRTPTAAVQHHLGISRAYAFRLRKLAEQRELSD